MQVRKSKYPATDHDEAMRLGQLATETDNKSIFKFNPGKQQSVFPASNNYTADKCNGCNFGAKETLAKEDELPKGKAMPVWNHPENFILHNRWKWKTIIEASDCL